MSTISLLNPEHRRRRSMRAVAVRNLPKPPPIASDAFKLWVAIRNVLIAVYHSPAMHGDAKHAVFQRGIRQMTILRA